MRDDLQGETLTMDHAGVEDDGWSADAQRYALGDELAHGGGGRVLVAVDRRLGREVAVKVPRENAGARLRLIREARLMARLEHPSIVPVHDAGRDGDGAPFYVMRLLDGETLHARAANRPFDERIALLPTLIAIAEAVAYAHHRGVVHRDLKPSNVIVGTFGETFVIDWGLGRAVADPAPEAVAAPVAATPETPSVTAAGAIVGTPAYMAPEQARGEAVDRRADVYGLGALIYHVLVGEPPYRGGSSAMVVAQVLEGPPPPATEREPRIPRELGAIVAQAMAREPADRYASARELAQDLQRYQAGRLVAAHRYTAWQRLRRRVRRHRGTLAIAGALALAGAALAIAWPSREADAISMCARAREVVTARWDERRRGAIAERVRASGEPGAAAAAPIIAERLARHADRLGAARIAACEATHVRGEQSEELLDRRMQCLDRRLLELQQMAGVVESMQPGELAAITDAAGRMSDAAPCTDAVFLRGIAPLPDDPVSRVRVLALRDQIAAARAQTEIGRYAAMRAPLEALNRDPALELHPPVAAEARFTLGFLKEKLGERDEALRLLREAAWFAEVGGDDRARGDALLELGSLARDLDRIDEAMQHARQILAIGKRTGDLELEVYALTQEANAVAAKGELAKSIELAQRALARWGDRDNDTVLGDLVGNVGSKLIGARRWADAEPYVRRAMAIHERRLGPEHPLLAASYLNLSVVLMSTDRAAEGLAVSRRGLELLERLGRGGSDDAMKFVSNIPVALTSLERYDEADAALKQLMQRFEKRFGPAHDNVTTVMYNLGNNRLLARDPAGAEPWFRAVLARREPALGPGHIMVANARWAIGEALVQQQKPAEALPFLTAALPVQLAETGEGSEDMAYAHMSLSAAYLDLRRPADALPHATAMQPYFEAGAVDERGRARLLLARALHDAGRERARALELAKQSRADLAASGRALPGELEQADRLLRAIEAP